MLTEIKLNGFASFKHETCLQTDKPLNFVYGLNGTGKSSISRYLADPANAKYGRCSLSPVLDQASEQILVYNQDFINENFVEKDHQQGIFTLSKGNKKAYDAVKNANVALAKLKEQAAAVEEAQNKANSTFASAEAAARDKVWELKSKYYGGDRVLDYCLEGVKSSKANLFAKVKDTIFKQDEDLRSIDALKQELLQLTAMEGKSYPLVTSLPSVAITEKDIQLAKRVIVGNQESTISSVIDEFANATWVRAGMIYLNGGDSRCPFCHHETITVEYIKELKSYFDESYERDIQSLRQLEQIVSETLARISPVTDFDENPIILPLREKYLLAYSAFKTALADTLSRVHLKIERPNIEQEIDNCEKERQAVNDIIQEANMKITAFNARVARLPAVRESIKEEFWKLQRREYDATFAAYEAAVKAYNKEAVANKTKEEEIEKQRKQELAIIASNQKDVVNVEEAIAHINSNLECIGITDFKIVKSEGENSYRISRSDEEIGNVFHTLSDGEKMLISLLYFIETCTGRRTADEPEKKKIIVIDDPISSLSHVHVFNVSCLLRDIFIDKHPFEQVFILTHSLYFFYEIVYRNEEKRKESQKLFRIAKNEEGSFVEEMHYSEIRNDYESYWSIVNDPKAPKALMANCMRNILDYFFGFVARLEFNNIFNIKELNVVRFNAFNHYMNRESHNGPENINDYKEFNYDDFQDAFQLIFEKTGFGDHYKKMRKVGAIKP